MHIKPHRLPQANRFNTVKASNLKFISKMMYLSSTAWWDFTLWCVFTESVRVFKDTLIMQSKFRIYFIRCFDCYFPRTLIIFPSHLLQHLVSGSNGDVCTQKCVKFIDNPEPSTRQTDGSSNLPDRHSLLISDLMITVCVCECACQCGFQGWAP